jgi:alpha-1,2-mannosyltransferase
MGPHRRTVGAAACYAVSAGICCTLAAFSAARFVDLHVYLLGGQAVRNGAPLYQLRYAGHLPFTYPPAAAIIFTVLTLAPWTATAALVTAASAVALPATLYCALRLPPVPSWLDRSSAIRLALAAGAAAVWLEPIHTTLAYGQINVFLALLILYDLSRADNARLKGAGIGLAAGIKLTPAIFTLYLLATRRYRAAAVAAAVFAATVLAGYTVLPASSASYWDMTFLNPAHVGGIQLVMNQSMLGAIARGLHTSQVTSGWLALIAATGLAGLALAARAGRAGNEALGFSLCAITALLVSPISWTHHWVIAVPALLLAALATWRRWAGARRAARPRPAVLAWLAVLAGVAVAGWSGLVRRVPDNHALHLSPLQLVCGDAYVLIGLGVLAVATWRVAPRPSRRSPQAREPG